LHLARQLIALMPVVETLEQQNLVGVATNHRVTFSTRTFWGAILA
jgi:hypothetical protein